MISYCRKTEFKKFHLPCTRTHLCSHLSYIQLYTYTKNISGRGLRHCGTLLCVGWQLLNDVSIQRPSRFRGRKLLVVPNIGSQLPNYAE